MHLIQRLAPDGERQVLATQDGVARVLIGHAGTRDLALGAIAARASLAAMVEQAGLGETVDLAQELEAGRLLPPIDHPEPARLWLAGTGLTHLGSAEGRDSMHKAAASGEATDSMRMFLEGLEGGKPADGAIGQQPEWFYKGDGAHLVGPEGALARPPYARDGGEEPEICLLYTSPSPRD